MDTSPGRDGFQVGSFEAFADEDAGRHQPTPRCCPVPDTTFDVTAVDQAPAIVVPEDQADQNEGGYARSNDTVHKISLRDGPGMESPRYYVHPDAVVDQYNPASELWHDKRQQLWRGQGNQPR